MVTCGGSWWFTDGYGGQETSRYTRRSMYTSEDFKTKKALKEAIKAGKVINVYEPGIGTAPDNGEVLLEGPHYPKPHTW